LLNFVVGSAPQTNRGIERSRVLTVIELEALAEKYYRSMVDDVLPPPCRPGAGRQ
jgi:hypothetical protein